MTTITALNARLAKLEAYTTTADRVTAIVRFLTTASNGGAAPLSELYMIRTIDGSLSLTRGEDETERAFIERAKSAIPPNGGNALRVLLEQEA